jgi:hypothetical protein
LSSDRVLKEEGTEGTTDFFLFRRCRLVTTPWVVAARSDESSETARDHGHVARSKPEAAFRRVDELTGSSSCGNWHRSSRDAHLKDNSVIRERVIVCGVVKASQGEAVW